MSETTFERSLSTASVNAKASELEETAFSLADFVSVLRDDELAAMRSAVNHRLSSLLQQQDLSSSLQVVMDEVFAVFLFQAARTEGYGSEVFRDNLRLLDAVLMTLKAPSFYTHRSQLMERIALTLPRLRLAFFEQGFEGSYVQAFFDEIETAHKTLIKTIDASLDEWRFEDLVRTHSDTAVASSDTPQTASTASPMPAFKTGLCFDWLLPSGKQRCQIAAYIRHRDCYVTTSVAGSHKVGDLSEKEFQHQIEKGEIVLLESNYKFEQALEQVIGGMRQR